MAKVGDKEASVPRPVPDVMLDRFLAGDLPPEKQSELEAQIAASPELEARVTTLRQERDAFYAADPPDAFAHRVAVKLDHEASREPARRRPWWAWLAAPSLAAAALVVVAVTYTQVGDPNATPSPVELLAPAEGSADAAKGNEETDTAAVAETPESEAAPAVAQPTGREPAPSPPADVASSAGPSVELRAEAGASTKDAKSDRVQKKGGKSKPKKKAMPPPPMKREKASRPRAATSRSGGGGASRREAKSPKAEPKKRPRPAAPPAPPPEPPPRTVSEPEPEPHDDEDAMALEAAPEEPMVDFDEPAPSAAGEALSLDAPLADDSAPSRVAAEPAPVAKTRAPAPTSLQAGLRVKRAGRWRGAGGAIARAELLMVTTKAAPHGYVAAVALDSAGQRTVIIPPGSPVRPGKARSSTPFTLPKAGRYRIYILFATARFSTDSALSGVRGMPSRLRFDGMQRTIDVTVE